MNAQMMDKNEEEAIFKEKIRCNICFEIPIVKEVVNGGNGYFITAECPNKHGVVFSALQDYCNDKSQIDKIKCSKCNAIQGKVKSLEKLFCYCKDCKKFYCDNCGLKHLNKHKKHFVTRMDKFDDMCPEHNSPFFGFCTKCNINICSLCRQKTHLKHEPIHFFKNIKPSEEKIAENSKKIETQKVQIGEINKILTDFLKTVNGPTKEYHDSLISALNFNTQVFNSFNSGNSNYQSLMNFNKIMDIDVTGDITWIAKLQESLDKLIKIIKETSSSNKTQQNVNPLNASQNIDKDLLNTFQESIVTNVGKSNIDILDSINKERDDDFTDNELLKQIGKKNKKLIKKKEIIGELKNIYIMNECNSYIILADNGIFIYDQEDNELLNYIDINDNLEYDEINSLTYFYSKDQNKIYLIIGTNNNKIKVFCIDENSEYTYELIQEIRVGKISNMFCNKNGDLLILEEELYNIYNFDGEQFEEQKQCLNQENETKNLHITTNHLIFTVKENGKDKIIFFDTEKFAPLFSIEDVKIDEKSKIFEISKNFVCVSCKEKIQVIDVEKKSLCNTFDNIKMDYIESADLINEKDLFLSCMKNNKLVAFILEWDNSNKTFKEKKNIEELECKIIKNLNKNKIILFTKYGVNIIEI